MTNINVSDYLSESDSVVSEVVPYAQWFNPQSGVIGLGIKDSQAELANFIPDETWKKKEVSFGEKKETFWISKSPRLLILNGANTVSATIKGNPRPVYMIDIESGVTSLFDAKHRTEQHKCFSYLVFCVIGKDKNLLSTPVRLKLSKASALSLIAKFEVFKVGLLDVCKELGIKFPAGKTPTSNFFAHCIYQPILSEGEAKASKSKASSQACLVTSINPVTVSNFTDLFISKKEEASTIIEEYVSNIFQYIQNSKGKEEIEPESEVGNLVTGEVELTPEMQELIKVPF
jgi:hypothetical protein